MCAVIYEWMDVICSQLARTALQVVVSVLPVMLAIVQLR